MAGATSYNIYWSTTPGVTIANGTKIAGSWNPKWKQTSANRTAAELRAAPEYFNQGAFATLFAASYPFSLPYSAGLDELRTYVGSSGCRCGRSVRRSCRSQAARSAQQAAVAAERLGLPPHGADLIATANLVAPEIAWNTPNPLLAVASVPEFMQAASITYESLLELLEIQWVQGGRGVAITGIDDTCMTSVQVLAPLDLGFLDRAHRFLRLWLATGYKMWELDLLLRAPAVGNGTLDQTALVALLQFQRLQDATRLARRSAARLLPGHRRREPPRPGRRDRAVAVRADLPDAGRDLGRTRPRPRRDRDRRRRRRRGVEPPPGRDPGGARRQRRRRGDAVRPYRRHADARQPQPRLPRQRAGERRQAADRRPADPRRAARPGRRRPRRRARAAPRVTAGDADVPRAGGRDPAVEPDARRRHVPADAAERDDVGSRDRRHRHDDQRRERRRLPGRRTSTPRSAPRRCW